MPPDAPSPAPSPDASTAPGGLLFLLFLTAAALIVYHGALPVPLGSDARFLTYRNDWVADPGGLARFWTADFFEGSRTHAFPYLSGYYRPVTNTLFWLEYRWAGDTDLLYNLGEVLLHALNAFLVFLVVGRLFEDRLAGALAGTLFVVHPVHAMAATEPAARGDLLFATFYLLGLWIFDGGLRGMAGGAGGGVAPSEIAGERARGDPADPAAGGCEGGADRAGPDPAAGARGRGTAWWAWAAAGLYALSLLSKEMGATFPAALLLLVLYRRFRDGIPWRAGLRTLPAWGVFVGYLVWRFGVLDLAPPDLGYAETHPPLAVLLAALKTVPIHLSRILLPLGASYPELNPELINFVSAPFAQSLTYAALLVVAGLLGAALLWKRHSALAFCSAFFLVTFTPLFRVENIAGSLGRDVVLTQERWIYLPAVAVFALLGMALARLWRRIGSAGLEADAATGSEPPTGEAGERRALAAGGASRRVRRAVAVAGLAALVVLLGLSAATHAGQHDNPFARLRRLYLIPEERLGRMQLANKRLLYANWVAVPMRDFDEAERRVRDALALAPDSPIVAYGVANVLAEAGRWEEVVRVLEPWEAPSAERLREHARTYVRVYDDLNRVNPAIAYLLGRARARLGQGAEGARLLCTALRRGISEEDVERALGELWRYAGAPACAAAADPAACAAGASAPPPALRAPGARILWAVGVRDRAPARRLRKEPRDALRCPYGGTPSRNHEDEPMTRRIRAATIPAAAVAVVLLLGVQACGETESSSASAYAVPAAFASAVQEAPTIQVYKAPTCGCCGLWVEHLEAEGFDVQTIEVNSSELVAVKQTKGVDTDLMSCHTAIVGDYVVEGHVPASDIARLLEERPDIAGLAVPGMPAGSPGMESASPQPYEVLTFGGAGERRVWASH